MDNEENNNVENNTEKQESKINTDELKEETKETFNRVKDQIKDTDFKAETKNATEFVKEMFVSPIEAVEEVATGGEVKIGRTLMLLIALLGTGFIYRFILNIKNTYLNFGDSLFNLVLSITSPLILILVYSLIIFVLNKENKKPLLVNIATIITARVPVIFINVFYMISAIIPKLSNITSIFTGVLSSLTIILTYFGMKALFEEDNISFVRKFVLVSLIASVIFAILSGIHLY